MLPHRVWASPPFKWRGLQERRCRLLSNSFVLIFRRTNIIATASTTEKLEWLRSIPNGATHAVNYKTQDFSKEVKNITSGAGVDVVLDFVGTTHWDKNIDSLGIDGRMVIFAFMSGRDPI